MSSIPAESIAPDRRRGSSALAFPALLARVLVGGLLAATGVAKLANLEQFAEEIQNYELAARMQLSIPKITDLSTEPEHVFKLYGADDSENPTKAAFARNCILARRLIESGVRFVQLFNGAYAMGEGVGNWDGHKSLKPQYDKHGPILDQPAAAPVEETPR